MSRALWSIELKFGSILYVDKNWEVLNVIKLGNVKVFNRLAGNFSNIGMLNYKRQLNEKRRKTVPTEFGGLGKTFEKKSLFFEKSSVAIQNNFGMGYIFLIR